VPYRGDGQAPGSDACPWEQPPADPLQAPREATWPRGVLTGRSLHAALLVPDESGEYVTDAYRTWATQHPPLEATDPYLVYDIDPTAPAKRRRSPRRADATHATFRALPALGLAGDEHRPGCRPEAFTTINSLPENTRAGLRVWVCGFDQEGQVNNRIWYTSLTPLIWPLAQENDPLKASRIAECCAAAETLGAALRKEADQAWKNAGLTPGPRRGGGKRGASLWASQALADYWPRAEHAFWQLIDDTRPAYGVFAAAAITSLAETTRDALNRLPKAGPALARAVQNLRRAGTSPDDTPRPMGGPHAQP
jgi:CRISPR system Cascade subunit CasA